MKVQVNCHPVVAQCGVAPTSQGGAGIWGLCRAKARRYKTDMGVYDLVHRCSCARQASRRFSAIMM